MLVLMVYFIHHFSVIRVNRLLIGVFLVIVFAETKNLTEQ